MQSVKKITSFYEILLELVSWSGDSDEFIVTFTGCLFVTLECFIYVA